MPDMRKKRQKSCGKMSKGFMKLDESQLIYFWLSDKYMPKKSYGFKKVSKICLALNLAK